MSFRIESKPHCPKCNTTLDGGMGIEDITARPKPGDITICVYCESLLCFTDDLQLRAMTFKERIELPEETQRALNFGLDKLREVKKEHPR